MAWTDRYNIPKSGLQAWLTLDDATDNSMILDVSGNSRSPEGTGSEAALQSDVLNGRQALYFSGANNPYVFDPGSTFPVRHIYCLASYEDAVFPATYGGLLSSLTSHGLLVGTPSASKFFDIDYDALGEYAYRLSDVVHPESNQVAPMAGTFKLIEIVFPLGWNLDGIQIGKDRGLSPARLWKGWFVEALMYDRVLSGWERNNVLCYFAKKFHVYPEDASGRFVFPFAANRSRPSVRDKEHYLSEPYTGTQTVLERGEMRRAIGATFELRDQEEVVAAEAFHASHYPDRSNTFTFRDYNYVPAKDRVVAFESGFNESGTEVSGRFTYAFEMQER